MVVFGRGDDEDQFTVSSRHVIYRLKTPIEDTLQYIPANSHALGVSVTPAGWKRRSHAGSRLRANFSRLIEKCELLPSCLTQFPKIC